MRKLYFYITLQLLFIANISAQQSGDLDVGFGKPELTAGDSSRFDGGLRKIIIQPDGNVLMAGDFDKYNGEPHKYLIRLKPDDNPDTTFHPGSFNSGMFDMLLQPDGKIVVCGQFDTLDGDLISGVARLNSDGSFDTTFALSFSPGVTGTKMALQPDGKIIVGGHFTIYRGETVTNYVRLNTDGTVDTSFTNNGGTGFDNWIQTVIVQPDGKIVFGGLFTMFNGRNCNHIARLNSDGTLDSLFYTYPSFSDKVLSLSLQPDGKIIVSGGYSYFDSTYQGNISRINTDGTRDTTFDTGSGFNDLIFETCVQPDGKILVGGRFALYDSSDRRDCLIRLNADGSNDHTFYSGAECSNTLKTIVLHSNGYIMLGGDFSAANNTKRAYVARLTPAGVLDGSLNVERGFTSIVTETCIQPDGKIIVSGDVIRYNGYGVSRIIRLLPDGNIDTTMHTTLNNYATEIVYDNAIDKIYAGGTFTSVNVTSRKGLVRLNLNGSIDSTFDIGFGFNQNVKAIAIQPDGKIIAGGMFNYYDSVRANGIARLLTDGNIDLAFNTGTGFNDEIKDIVIQPDGKVVVCGSFSMFNGQPAFNILRLNANGSMDTSFHFTSGLNGYAASLALQNDGKILIGGVFTQYNGNQVGRIVRAKTDGRIDSTFNCFPGFASGSVNEIILQPDGKILAAGEFNNYKNHSSRSVVRINTDGSHDNTFVAQAGFNNKLRTFSLQPDGRIICGGEFTSYQQYHINYLCRLESVLPVYINEVSGSDDLFIYPNPSSGNIRIELTDKYSLPADIRITNLMGQEIQKEKLISYSSDLNISQKQGMYLMTISDGKNVFTKKIIIR